MRGPSTARTTESSRCAGRQTGRGGFVFTALLALALSVFSTLSAMPAAATTTLSDPVGDVFVFGTPPPGLVLPDLIEISGGFTATDLILSATFAPGTLTPGITNTFFSFGLDLDLNDRTGTDFIRGAEQQVMFHTSLTHAFVCSRILVVPAECSAEIPVFVDTDFLSVTLSLGPDGIDDDGVARFGFVAGMLGNGGPISEDVAYDITSPVERNFTAVTSAVVPEPSTAILVLTGLFTLAARRQRRA